MKGYLVQATLALDTPLHIGTGVTSDVTDSPVYRDSFGLYRIPGTSLAGVLRDAVAQSASGSGVADEIFGRGGDDESQGWGSRCSVSDGYLVDLDGRVALEKTLAGIPVDFPFQSVIQDCVRIDEDSGTAVEGAKFDLELVPPGTRFAIELEYMPRSGQDRLDVLKRLLVDLREGRLQLGGGTTRGLGAVHADTIALFEFDLDSPEGLHVWQSRPYGVLDPLPSSARKVRLGDEGLETRRDDDTLTGTLRVQLEATGPLLIGGTPVVTDESKEADLTFLEIPFADYETESLRGVAWIPGSTLKGVIRHRAEYVLRSLSLGDDERRAAVIDSLFGCVKPVEQADGSVKTVASKSKVTIRGCLVKEPAYVTVQHVAIDRLTGGALDGALYAESPVWSEGTRVPIRIDLDGITPAEACLLAHVLMDLGEGHLPIGGGGRRGNGRLRFLNSDQLFPAKGDTRFSLAWRGKSYTQDSPRDELAELLSSLESGFQQTLA